MSSVCTTSTGERFASSCRLIPGSGGQYRCRDFDGTSNGGRRLLGECDGTYDRPCPADTFCNITCAGSPSICSVYALHGAQCDSNFTGGTLCSPCAPGTTCVAQTDLPDGYTGRCRKACSDDADCPCEDDGSQQHVCQHGSCYECKGENEFCGQSYACCDSTYELECGGDDKCCRSVGEECSEHSDCCHPQAFCNAGGDCEACLTATETCTSDDECCSGLGCTAGVCRTECVEGQSCSSSGADGICGDNATWDCTVEPPVCEPGDPDEIETCNGLDDNCNGQVDETFPEQGTCLATPGFPCDPAFEVTGQNQCINGQVECVAEAGVDYCSFNSQIVGGQSCGDYAGASCTDDGDCIPNSICTSFTHVCSWDEANCGSLPTCWMPANNDECGYEG